MIEIKNLTKVYKLNKKQMKESKTKSNRKVAVDHLSLNAHKGEIYDPTHKYLRKHPLSSPPDQHIYLH